MSKNQRRYGRVPGRKRSRLGDYGDRGKHKKRKSREKEQNKTYT